jgi:hypothetical protein
MPQQRDIANVLSSVGLAPGPEGFAWSDLVAFADANGWRAGTEEVPRPTPWTRYRAIVWRPGDPRLPEQPTLTARGRGQTEEQALAAALASALKRWSRYS